MILCESGERKKLEFRQRWYVSKYDVIDRPVGFGGYWFTRLRYQTHSILSLRDGCASTQYCTRV